jgi:Domain of unknown function (DUF4055)
MVKNNVTQNRIPADAMERWALVRAVISGDQAMRKGEYLPYLNRADVTAENMERNASYVERAVFYSATARTLDGLMGLAFRKDPDNNLPDYLSDLLINVDGAKNSIYQQSQLVAANVLQVGRHGLMVGFDSRLNRPVIKSYAAENIINWCCDDGRLVMLVLREDAEVFDGYIMTKEPQFRELFIEDEKCICRVWRLDKKTQEPYLVEVTNSKGEPAKQLVVSSFTKPLNFIPFRFVGSQNNDECIDDSPMYGLARLNLAHYRNSADYEDSVFIHGQAQMWMSGLTEEWRDHLQSQKTMYVGSRTPLLLPVGGAMGFAQVAPNTLAYEAMEQKEKQMVALGARLLDDHAARMSATQSDNDRENSTSVLSMVIANVNEAYQSAIEWCALMIDKPLSDAEKQSTYKIRQSYSNKVVDSQALLAMVSAWQSGVIAKMDVRSYLRESGLLSVERIDEDIDSDLEMEGPSLGLMGGDELENDQR